MAIVALVNAISDDLVAKWSAAGKPPLTDGGIVIGRVRVDENSSPPRVVFIPRGSRFGPRSTPLASAPASTKNPLTPGAGVRSYTMIQYGGGYSATPTVTVSAPDLPGGLQATAIATVRNGSIAKLVPLTIGSGYTSAPTVTITDGTGTLATATANMERPPQALSVIQQRAILTEFVMFEVQCWNVASPADANNDFDETQLLYKQVIASTWLLAPGICQFSAGKWADSAPNSTQVDLYGHLYVFGIELAVPVTDSPLAPAMTPAPVGVQPNPTNYIVPFDGSAREVGSTG